MTDSRTNNSPVATKRYGRIQASIFEHSGQNQQGEAAPYHRTTFTRTYTDPQGQPQSSSSFSDADLLKVKELAGWAFERSQELRSQSARQNPKVRRTGATGDAFEKAERAGNAQSQELSRE